MFDDYYYYATAIIIISFGSILISVYQTKKVVKGLEIIEYLKEGKRKTEEKRREVRGKKEKK